MCSSDLHLPLMLVVEVLLVQVQELVELVEVEMEFNQELVEMELLTQAVEVVLDKTPTEQEAQVSSSSPIRTDKYSKNSR